MNTDEKIRAAYALNLWTVSISQIVDYEDINVMEQEYDAIMNNLNLENMPKDEALLDVIKEIMDEITNYRMEAGDLKIIEKEYQNWVKERGMVGGSQCGRDFCHRQSHRAWDDACNTGGHRPT